MANYCHTTVAGRLTRDCETINAGGTTVTKFSIAWSERWNDKDGNKQERSHYLDCDAWGRAGETIERFHGKGDPILLAGSLQLDQWEDKDGTKRSKIKLRVDRFDFIKPYDPDAAPKQSPASAPPLSDDDIPF